MHPIHGNPAFVMEQMLEENPTDLYYIERNALGKDVNTNNIWTF